MEDAISGGEEMKKCNNCYEKIQFDRCKCWHNDLDTIASLVASGCPFSKQKVLPFAKIVLDDTQHICINRVKLTRSIMWEVNNLLTQCRATNLT